MSSNNKIVTVSGVLLNEKSVIFPGEFVRLKDLNQKITYNSLPSPDDAAQKALSSLVEKFSPKDKLLFVVPIINRKQSDLGTICKVSYSSKSPESFIVRGIARAHVLAWLGESEVKVEIHDDNPESISPNMLSDLQSMLLSVIKKISGEDSKFYKAIQLIDLNDSQMSSPQVIDTISAGISFTVTTRIQLFFELNASKRYELLMDSLRNLLDGLDDAVSKKQQSNNKSSNSLSPRTNPRKLSPAKSPSPNKADSDGDQDDEDDLAAIKAKLNKCKDSIPTEGQKVIAHELKRAGRSNPQSMEFNVILNYLETISEIPWANNKPPLLSRDSIKETQTLLDIQNYGLQLPKKRLVEYIAITYLKQLTAPQKQLSAPKDDAEIRKNSPPIVLLVGPPGVGKTSLAKSVASAMHKPLYRISLGGVRDEAEIRGHRRTYVGAMPGVFVEALTKAGSMSPVLVLDEIDKVSGGGNSSHGDPAAALLEVLDPAQNNTFKDHYIDFPIDLSQVTFIATANYLDSIPRALLDRMEVIHIEGYTYQEKLQIAQRFLVPKQLEISGIPGKYLAFDDGSILKIISEYTHESGVRELERKIGAVCRGWAVENLEKMEISLKDTDDHKLKQHVITTGNNDIEKFLGPCIYSGDMVHDDVDKILVNGKIQYRHHVGVVNGLAYMSSGLGGILVLEATMIPHGTGQLTLTGKLGEVMTESANIAISWVRANSNALKIPLESLQKYNYHLHAPAGAIPKDGPSAGVAMTICLVSLLLNKPIPRDMAMTGEMTLRGKVLPVGGIREKLLGAHMAGARRILLPYQCKEVVENEKSKGVEFPDLDLYYIKYIWDALALVWPNDALATSGQRSAL